MSRPYLGPSESQSQANAEAARKREQRYIAPHEASQARRAKPSGFRAQLREFLAAWTSEVPDQMTGSGTDVWHDRKWNDRDDPKTYQPVGGSLLGSPPEPDALGHYLYEPTSRTEYATSNGREETSKSYAAPMHWAITWLEQNRHPLIATVLRFLGRNGGDYKALSVTCGKCSKAVPLPDEYAEAIARDALGLVWSAYLDEPKARRVA